MPSKADEKLLEKIRKRYKYAMNAWREIREERAIDMRYLLGDPWDDKDKKHREDAGRPAISHDELNQYVNQAINNVRQNKRGIKVDPGGENATDESAALEQDLIRAIEYRSQAQSAYITAFQGAVEGSYGFFGLSRRYIADDSFDQEIRVRNLPNSDSVLYDPDCKEADGSDAGFAFVLDPVPKERFEREHPNAEKTSFTEEDAKLAPEWIQDNIILLAEYWERESTQSKLYLLKSGEVVTELPDGEEAQAERTVEKFSVIQYLTNGVEILARNPQPGTEIPIFPVYGKEMYVNEGAGSSRKLISLVRLARDPQMTLAFLVSQQLEEAALTPKVPWVGYKGAFEDDPEAWENSTKVPYGMLQAGKPDWWNDAWGPPPLPERTPFTPNFAAFEASKESTRRAIQAAMGIMPLPTVAQEQNQKSGVALDKIQGQQAIGSFHFVDNFDRALMRAGHVIDSWIPVVYDTERTVALRAADDSHRLVRINTAEPYMDQKTKQPVHYQIKPRKHDVTVSTGPSYDSQRNAVADFLDLLVQHLATLPISPPQAAKLLSIAIRMRNMGPLGDQMADLISPPDSEQMSPQAQAALAQLQQQLQAATAMVQQLTQERQGKVAENQGRAQIEQIKSELQVQLERMKIEAQVLVAEITTKAQNERERMKLEQDLNLKLHVSAHETAMQAQQHAQSQQVAQEAAAQQVPHESAQQEEPIAPQV